MSMKKLIATLALLLVGAQAEAAITLVACSSDDANGVTNLTAAEPTGTVQNDVVVAYAARGSNTDDGDWVDPADFTQGDLQDETTGNADGQLYWGYKVRGATAGNALTWTFGGTATGMSLIVCSFRGVDTTTPIDVTYVDATHYVASNNAHTTAAKPITTVTNNAWVLILQNLTQELDGACVAPAGYTIQLQTSNCAANNSRHALFATKEKAVAGVETPGVWGQVDTDGNADTRQYTIALRPAVAAPPTFAFAPACSATTNGVSCTYTASATSTAYGVCVSPGDGAPSVAQVKAGQNDGGTAALWTGSDANTGTADTINVTGANKPPRMDCYFALSNGAGDSSVDSSQTDKDRTARAGYTVIALATLSVTGLFDCPTCFAGGTSSDAYYSPDVASGFMLEYEAATNESANCKVLFSVAGNYVFYDHTDGANTAELFSGVNETGDAGNDSIADCVGRVSFEYCLEDPTSATTGLMTAPACTFATDDTVYVNNTAPVCSPEPEEELIALTRNVAMAARNFNVVCSDVNADLITYTFTTGALPTGTTLSGTGNQDWTGTPTVENETGVATIVTATDVANETATYAFTRWVIDTWTMVNCNNTTPVACQALVLAAAPWRVLDPLISIGAYTCGSGQMFGNVGVQSPTSTTQLAAYDVITINLVGIIPPSVVGMSAAAARALLEALCP